MHPQHRVFALATLLLFIVLAGAGISLVRGAELSTSHPFPGVAWYCETRQEPPMRLFIAEIELTNSNVRLRVAPGGPDPDGPGPWQTTLMPPTQVAAREGFELVVNGDFFDARGARDAEGTNSSYRAAAWACARPGGHRWKGLGRPTTDDWEVVAGNTMLVQDGSLFPHANKVRHPRTAVGLDARATRLILLVVDGRKPGIAVGMTYDELAAEMMRLGCRQALNLDGGGSSIMAVRDPVTGAFRILNGPTDGHERPVANVLGVCASGSAHQ